MQKQKIKQLAMLCVAAIAFSLAFARYDKIFDSLKAIPFLGWIIAYNFPPADYYVPCATFQLSEVPCTKLIMCRYKGRYDIHIHNIPTNQFDTSGVSLSVRLTDEDGADVLCVDKCDSGIFAYYNRKGDFGYRYFFLAFNVPDDVPLNKSLCLSVSASGEVEKLLSRCPAAEIEVVKCFDK
jgi:hypothetical protein